MILFMIRFAIYFSISFFILSLPIAGKPVFSYVYNASGQTLSAMTGIKYGYPQDQVQQQSQEVHTRQGSYRRNE